MGNCYQRHKWKHIEKTGGRVTNDPSNNKGELLAALAVIKATMNVKEVNHYSDSKYTIGMIGEWGDKREKRNKWKTPHATTIRNIRKLQKERKKNGQSEYNTILSTHKSDRQISLGNAEADEEAKKHLNDPLEPHNTTRRNK